MEFWSNGVMGNASNIIRMAKTIFEQNEERLK